MDCSLRLLTLPSLDEIHGESELPCCTYLQAKSREFEGARATAAAAEDTAAQQAKKAKDLQNAANAHKVIGKQCSGPHPATCSFFIAD